MSERIYLSPPHMTGEELEFIRDAFESNWLAPLGPHVDAFEREVAERVGVGYALALSSGTAALHLALICAGVGPGDEVLVSDLTFAGSVFPISYLGARPVFIDSDTESWNMDPHLLAEELNRLAGIGELPKAVVAVHLYGQCADIDALLSACEVYNIPLIEDAAEALGARYKNREAGSFGQSAILSFNGNKILTTSGGGMLLSNDGGLVAKSRKLSTQARESAVHYEHCEIGYNYRMSNVLAAMGRGQLHALDYRVATRRKNFDYYEDRLSHLPGLSFMPEPAWSYSSHWLSVLTVDPDQFGADREDIRVALEAENIEARPVWKPMHMQPVFLDERVVGGAISESLFQRGLCLPSGTRLSQADLDHISSIVESVYQT